MFRIIASIALCAAVVVALPLEFDEPVLELVQVQNGVAAASCNGARNVRTPVTKARELEACSLQFAGTAI